MWKAVKLKDVCIIKTGRKDVNEGNQLGQYPFFTCAKEHTFSEDYSFDCEAILIAGNGAVGQTTYYKGKFEAYQRTYVLSAFKNIEPKLLLFILQGKLMNYLSSMVLGNTIPYIKKGMLQDFEFVLPPLKEQQRIVAKLDATFAEIDTALQLTHSKEIEIEQLETILLSNFLNDRALMLEEVKLEDVCLNITDGSHFSPKTVEDGFPYITVRDINDDGINFINCKFISKESYLELEKNGCSPSEGDVLFSKDGTVGKVAEVKTKKNFVVLSSLAILTPNKDLVTTELLAYILKSQSFLKQAIGKKTGVAIRRIILKNLKKICFNLPPLVQQHSIVSKLDAAFAEIVLAKDAIKKNKVNYHSLKSSILTQELQREVV